MKTTETWDCASVKLSARDQYTRSLDWNRLRVTLFTSPFLPDHTRTEAFSKRSAFLSFHLRNRFRKTPFSLAFSSGAFQRISVHYLYAVFVIISFEYHFLVKNKVVWNCHLMAKAKCLLRRGNNLFVILV